MINMVLDFHSKDYWYLCSELQFKNSILFINNILFNPCSNHTKKALFPLINEEIKPPIGLIKFQRQNRLMKRSKHSQKKLCKELKKNHDLNARNEKAKYCDKYYVGY